MVIKPISKNIRVCGNTTRLVDYYVQALFDRNKIIVYESHNNTHSGKKANKELFKRVVRRLEIEHKHILKELEIDKLKLTITWL